MNQHSSIQDENIDQMMQSLGQHSQEAAHVLASATTDIKNQALEAMADQLLADTDTILAANASDINQMREQGDTDAFIDRSILTATRLEAMAQSLRDITALADPVGEVIAQWQRPNGLEIERVRTPIGVIGVIFEARPNVTADAGALCLKSGNAVILRGGSSCHGTNIAVHAAMIKGLAHVGLPQTAIQIIPTTDRSAVGAMLKGLDGSIDVIVPRGGRSLVERVQKEARVPVFAHLEGLCHIYIQPSADVTMAQEICVNAKMRRPGICGATETLLFDKQAADTHITPVLDALSQAGCEVRADEAIQAHWPNAQPATEEDWRTEYLAPVISAKMVEDIEDAMSHIATYGSGHTDCILTEDQSATSHFQSHVDSAIVMHNCSTQFADGGEFGMGAEIGIATGKMHARGPVGLEQLTSFKYVVRGQGQTRPV